MLHDDSNRHLARSIAEARRRPPFVWQHRYIPTAFSRRLVGVLEYALATRQWYLVFAQSGDGKSTTLRHFRTLHPDFDNAGARQRPVLATRTPTGRQSADHLVLALADGLGVVPNLKSTFLRTWLPGAIERAGVGLIVIDDAHELTMYQLNYLRELTDRLNDRGVRVGIVLLAVAKSASPLEQPIWQRIEKTGLDAIQFSNRLDGVSPLVLVVGLSEVEVGAVLKTFEQRYRAIFPTVQLAIWTPSVFVWLTEERIDRAGLRRVRMGALCDLVKGALQAAWARGMPGLDAEGTLFHEAAVRLAGRGGAFELIDGDDEKGGSAAAGPHAEQAKAA